MAVLGPTICLTERVYCRRACMQGSTQIWPQELRAQLPTWKLSSTYGPFNWFHPSTTERKQCKITYVILTASRQSCCAAELYEVLPNGRLRHLPDFGCSVVGK